MIFGSTQSPNSWRAMSWSAPFSRYETNTRPGSRSQSSTTSVMTTAPPLRAASSSRTPVYVWFYSHVSLSGSNQLARCGSAMQMKMPSSGPLVPTSSSHSAHHRSRAPSATFSSLPASCSNQPASRYCLTTWTNAPCCGDRGSKGGGADGIYAMPSTYGSKRTTAGDQRTRRLVHGDARLQRKASRERTASERRAGDQELGRPAFRSRSATTAGLRRPRNIHRYGRSGMETRMGWRPSITGGSGGS
jgi:hypothetical protein